MIVDRILNAAGLVRQKSLEQAVRATVTSADMRSFRHGRGPAERDAWNLIQRAEHWVSICANLNARVCAGQTLRLYRSGRGPTQRGVQTRAIDRRRMAYLKGHTQDRPSLKAVGYAGDAENVEEITSHPCLDMLRRPTAWYSGTEFAEVMFYAMEITGNAYAHPDLETRTIFPFMPQWTRADIDEEEFIRGYWYGAQQGREEFFDRRSVVHMRFRLGLTDPYYGEGPLHHAIREADIYSSARESEESTWDNNGQPAWWLDLRNKAGDDVVTDEQAQEYMKLVQSQFAGPQRSGKVYIGHGIPTPLAFSPREMEYLAGIDNLERFIQATYGTPESLLRLNDANLASSQTGHIQYARFTIAPRINRYADDLTESYLPLFNLTPGEYYFAYDNPVPEDEAALTAQQSQLVSAGLITVNEARAALGMDSIEGGDELRNTQPETPADPFGGLFSRSAAGCCGFFWRSRAGC